MALVKPLHSGDPDVIGNSNQSMSKTEQLSQPCRQRSSVKLCNTHLALSPSSSASLSIRTSTRLMFNLRLSIVRISHDPELATSRLVGEL